ncbi:MAG: hypothetical protein MI748_21275, partial [Opitutales bacterium]|nr:hypothetical protein [Opitutales bacterium]
KQELIIKAKELNKDGFSTSKISQILNIDRRTATKYIKYEIEQIYTNRDPTNNYSQFLGDIINAYSHGQLIKLTEYFPDIDLAKLKEVEGFHDSIAII